MQNPFNPVQQLLALHSLGRFAEMERQARQLLRGNGNVAILNELLGVALSGQKKFSEALPYLQKAVRREPKDALFWENLALCQRELREFAHAEKSLRQSLSLRPDNPEALNALGSVLREQGRHDEARKTFERVLASAPTHGPAHFNLGRLFVAQEMFEQAERHLRRAIECGQDNALAHRTLGCALQYATKFAEAARHFQRAVDIEPEHFLNYGYLAQACYELGETKRASDLIDHAFARLGDVRAVMSAETIDDLDAFSSLLCDMHRYGEAVRILAVTAESPLGNRRKRAGRAVYAARHVCDWRLSTATESEALDFGDEAADILTPFAALSLAGATPAKQLAIARNFARKYATGQRYVPRAAASVAGGTRLRIGYLSPDFHDHATSILVAGTLLAHDRSRFEIFAYDYAQITAGAYRDRIARGVEHFVPLQGLGEDAALQKIADDHIDILVDLKGWTGKTWTGNLSRRVAPLQVQWLGFPGTLGASWFDYIVADPVLIRPGDEAFYTEKVVRLPGCYQPNDNQRESPSTWPRSRCGLPDDVFVFGCFNQNYKFTPEVFDIWMRLLRGREDSVLWLLATQDETVENLRREASSRGVAPDRLIFAPPLPMSDHFARIGNVDLALDCFPCNAHTSASDLLWMGVPMIGLSGETFASRVSESILAAAGLHDLATRSFDSYFELAARCAHDAAFLAGIRATLRACRQSPLFDTRSFTRNLERGLDLIWQRHSRGLPPDHISVEPEAPGR